MQILFNLLKGKLEHPNEIYADLSNSTYSSNTLPSDIISSNQRPDIVVVNRRQMTIALIELSVCWDLNTETAHQRKIARYTDLQTDLQARGYKTILSCYEIGALGHITERNITTLTNTLSFLKVKYKKAPLIDAMSITALTGSFAIFRAHTQPVWDNPPLLVCPNIS